MLAVSLYGSPTAHIEIATNRPRDDRADQRGRARAQQRAQQKATRKFR
jgi:hypothetical protein